MNYLYWTHFLITQGIHCEEKSIGDTGSMSLSGQDKRPEAGSTGLLKALQALLPVCGTDFLVEGHYTEMRFQGSTQEPEFIVGPIMIDWAVALFLTIISVLHVNEINFQFAKRITILTSRWICRIVLPELLGWESGPQQPWGPSSGPCEPRARQSLTIVLINRQVLGKGRVTVIQCVYTGRVLHQTNH